MAKRRKVGNLLALAVLTLAAEQPMHPYEMATTLRGRGKDHSIKINWGSLYTVVQSLERHGLIEATGTVREGRRPERTTYAITEAGQAELRDWMRELVGTYTKEYAGFEAGLAELPVLPPDEVVELLGKREEQLRAVIAARQEMVAQVQDLPRLFLIETEYELAMLRAEADWVRSFRAELADGTFPGLALWREFHAGQRPLPEIVEQFERGDIAD